LSWHEEVLDAGGLRAAGRLAPAAYKFYLAGGTGLALRWGHRLSLDLDLFSPEDSLGAPERSQLLGALRASGPVEVEEERDGTCHLRLEGTRVSFLRYPYPLLKPPDLWKGIAVASPEDIAAMKVSAVIGRGTKKDFIDLHEIAIRIGLETALRCAAARYPSHPDLLMQAARALVYFDDAEKEPMPRLLKRVSWEKTRSFFEKETPKIVGKRLGY